MENNHCGWAALDRDAGTAQGPAPGCVFLDVRQEVLVVVSLTGGGVDVLH